MIHILLLSLAFLGFSLLAIARDRHQRDILGHKLAPSTAKWLRRGGGLLVLLAYPAAGIALGWGYGAVEWLGQLSAGALLTVLLLNRLASRKASS